MTASSRILVDAALVIETAAPREVRRYRRRQRARQVLLDIHTGLIVLAAFIAACVWIAGAVATANWLIGVFS